MRLLFIVHASVSVILITRFNRKKPVLYSVAHVKITKALMEV